MMFCIRCYFLSLVTGPLGWVVQCWWFGWIWITCMPKPAIHSCRNQSQECLLPRCLKWDIIHGSRALHSVRALPLAPMGWLIARGCRPFDIAWQIAHGNDLPGIDFLVKCLSFWVTRWDVIWWPCQWLSCFCPFSISRYMGKWHIS